MKKLNSSFHLATGGTKCLFFKTARGCRNGQNCRFVHESGDMSSASASMPLCKFYRTADGCRYGDSCYFRHDDPTAMLKDQMEKKIDNAGDTLQTKEKKEPCPMASLLEYMQGALTTEVSDPESPDDEEEEKSDSESDHSLLDSEEERTKRFDVWKKKLAELDKPRPDVTIAKCSCCDYKVKGKDAFDQLKSHYHEKLLKSDFKHNIFIKTPLRKENTLCLLCDRLFEHCGSLLRHMFDKTRRDDEDGKKHMEVVDKGILEPVCFRDIVHHDNDLLNEELKHTLVQDTKFDGLEDLFQFALLSQRFGPCSKKTSGHKSGVNAMLSSMLQAHGKRNPDVSDSDDGLGAYFDSDDEFELLCQGIKPWDPEAGAALAILNGGW